VWKPVATVRFWVGTGNLDPLLTLFIPLCYVAVICQSSRLYSCPQSPMLGHTMGLFSRNHSGISLCGSHHRGGSRYGTVWSSLRCESKRQRQSRIVCSRKCSQISPLVLCGQRPLTRPEGEQNEGLIMRLLH